MKKWGELIVYVACVLGGLVLLYCNLNKIVPGFESDVATFVTIIVAYGFFIGFALIGLGLMGILDSLGLM